MAARWGARLGGAVAGLLAAATVVLIPSPASACSFAFPHDLAIAGEPEAGGTLHIVGQGFVAIEGEVDSMCGGDYTFVPAAPVTIVVDFTTLSGPRSVALTAPVSGPRIPSDDDDLIGLEANYTIDVTTAIPLDATAVVAHVADGSETEAEATISGAVATTVPVAPAGPAAPPAAAPANAVAGSPTFTG